MSEVRVDLGERSYVITIGAGVMSRLGGIVASIRKPTRAAVLSNPVIARYYAEPVLTSLAEAGIEAELVVVPSGERSKTLGTVSRVYDALLDMKMDRGGAVIALGGGVIGDMAGFAAATYMRGIDFYQVPTTLLAQVDASIGGKTGVDLPRGKNLVGAFHQPRAVVIDILTLNTLPVRELRSGLAEVVKHGIIYDQEYYDFLDSRAADILVRKGDVIEDAVRRSVEIKRDVVQADERESGLRAILNYGHTVGHAIEMLSGYGKYRHGEASSIGMVTEALLAEMCGYAERGIASEIARTLKRFRLPVTMDSALDTAEIVRAIELDKKTVGGSLRLALPTRIGSCEVFGGISREALAGAIEQHRERE
ncbi:MAG: 3-dehydroquinate synthase [Armatimonadetes bacterium]|nr:3-dehydroquinate synthase [Armatimonadota bacterium]